jgi:hypothetical protein
VGGAIAGTATLVYIKVKPDGTVAVEEIKKANIKSSEGGAGCPD